MNKENLIEHFKIYGKDDTWDNLAEKFNLVSGDAARGIIRRFKEKDNHSIEKGTMLRKKVWETHKGEKRESIVYDYSNQNKLDLTAFKESLVSELKSIKKVPRIKRKELKDPILLEVSLPDIHYGKGDKTELEENFRNSILDLVQKAAGLNIERILFPIGNDGMNVDNHHYTTHKGTPQFDTMEWHQSFTGYAKLIIEQADILSSIAPVDIMVITGNHDEERMFYLGEVVNAYFFNNQNVRVNNKFKERKYYQYGKNMLMFTHGEKEKPKDLAMNMPIEEPKMFSDTEHREVHCGHFHKEMVLDEFKTIKVRFIPSICTTDTWHKKMGYMAHRCAQAYIWSKTRGFEGYLQSNIEK